MLKDFLKNLEEVLAEMGMEDVRDEIISEALSRTKKGVKGKMEEPVEEMKGEEAMPEEMLFDEMRG